MDAVEDAFAVRFHDLRPDRSAKSVPRPPSTHSPHLIWTDLFHSFLYVMPPTPHPPFCTVTSSYHPPLSAPPVLPAQQVPWGTWESGDGGWGSTPNTT